MADTPRLVVTNGDVNAKNLNSAASEFDIILPVRSTHSIQK